MGKEGQRWNENERKLKKLNKQTNINYYQTTKREMKMYKDGKQRKNVHKKITKISEI